MSIMRATPHPSPSLVREVSVGKGNAKVLLGSDWHFKTDNPENTSGALAERVGRDADAVTTGERFLVTLGDFFDVYGKEPATEHICNLLDALGKRFDGVFMVEGNHDVRRVAVPFAELHSLPKNIIYPTKEEPTRIITVSTMAGEFRLQLSNVFPGEESLLPKDILDVYGIGELSAEEMAQLHPDNDPRDPLLAITANERRVLLKNAVSRIDETIDVLALHPVPSAAAIELPAPPGIREKLEAVPSVGELGITLITDERKLEDIIRNGLKWDSAITPERQWQLWVSKAAADIGVPLLQKIWGKIRDGLVIMHGHNHRKPYTGELTHNGKSVRIESHQAVQRT